MDVKGIGSHNIINLYNKNNNKIPPKETLKKSSDSIQISSLGKSLTDFSLEGLNINNDSRVLELKSKVDSGTYKADAKLTAQGIINFIKESRIR